MKKEWMCNVCGYVYSGEKPPNECPQCSSSSKEFKILREQKKLSYDGKKFDVLLINGSSHGRHNTGIIADIAEGELKRQKINYKRFNLNELSIKHCWCCYSMRDEACTYPCRNQLDDMPALHEMIMNCKAVIIASPINWNNMSARLKDFLDRLTCIQNLCLVKKETPVMGKTLGILINGHEDGALKIAMDIFIYFQQMGFILAPYGFAYRTHGAEHNTSIDDEFFEKDKKIRADVETVISNVIELMKEKLDEKLNKRIKGVCE